MVASLIHWLACDVFLIIAFLFVCFFLLLLFLFFFLLLCVFHKGFELLITEQVTNIESVRKMSVIIPVKIQYVYFQFMSAINLPLQFTEVHGWVSEYQA